MAKPIVWVTFVSSVITDLYLLAVPLPMLWGTSLRLAKKLAVTAVLGAGIFVLVCSLLKTVFVEIVSSGRDETSYLLSISPGQEHIF